MLVSWKLTGRKLSSDKHTFKISVVFIASFEVGWARISDFRRLTVLKKKNWKCALLINRKQTKSTSTLSN